MSYIFLILIFVFLLLNGIVIAGMVRYVVPHNFRLFFSGLLIFVSTFQYVYQFFSSYFVNSFSYRVNQILSYIVYYYMAFIIYAAGFFIIAGILTMIFRGKGEFNFYRGAFLLTLVVLAAGTYFKHSTVITEYEVDSKGKLKSPMNIVMVSDIHLGYINDNDNIKKLTKMINQLNPDAVLIAGDLIDFHLDPVLEKNMLSELKNIKSRVFFAIGNHEIYGGKTSLLVKTLNDYSNVQVQDLNESLSNLQQ